MAAQFRHFEQDLKVERWASHLVLPPLGTLGVLLWFHCLDVRNAVVGLDQKPGSSPDGV